MLHTHSVFSTTAEKDHHNRNSTDPKYPILATCKLIMSNLNRH